MFVSLLALFLGCCILFSAPLAAYSYYGSPVCYEKDGTGHSRPAGTAIKFDGIVIELWDYPMSVEGELQLMSSQFQGVGADGIDITFATAVAVSEVRGVTPFDAKIQIEINGEPRALGERYSMDSNTSELDGLTIAVFMSSGNVTVICPFGWYSSSEL